MNYWPAEVTNLSETHEPLFGLVQDLSVTGRETARTMYGCNGWVDEAGILRLSYFRTTEQNSPGLMQFANRNPPEPPYTRKLMSPTNQHLSGS